MKLSKLSFVVLTIIMCAAATALADHPNDHPTGEASEHPSEHPTDQAAEMDAWMKAGTPGAAHAFLAKKTGSWTVESKMWMEPNGEPMVTENKSEFEMVLGGRFLMEHVSGTTMGMPFEGMGITGYNNTTGEATAVWYDNFGTVTTVLSGPYPEIGEPMILSGTTMDPMAGNEMTIRTVTTFVNDDQSRFEYFVSMSTGDEMKMMELNYKRD